MDKNKYEILTKYGWNSALQEYVDKSIYSGAFPGRVLVVHKTRYQIIGEDGEFSCELAGNLLYGRDAEELPCTGDWVLFQEMEPQKGIILDVFPRSKSLYRLKSGSVSEKQVIAAHVDTAFVVQSVDDFFSVRRIERFLLQLVSEDISPVLILTKTDLEFDQSSIDQALSHLRDKVPVLYTRSDDPKSIKVVRTIISDGKTHLFTGMSGVGKSTLINILFGDEVVKTSEISSSTGKGRHTTTRREMLLMPGGGVLIDTPGVKLFGITESDDETISEVLNLDAYTGLCRFKDCTHVNEKGCAVIEAVENGEIDSGVYANYLKMRKESWHHSASVHEKRSKEKNFARMVKEVNRMHNKRKG